MSALRDPEAVGDPELWSHVLEGDGRSFGLLFDRHRDRVHSHIRRLVDDAGEAEDLTAAAFLELWRRRASARIVDGSLIPWLLVTAGNVTSNANRARRRYRRFLSALPAAVSEPDHADGVAARLDLEPRVRELLAAIADLPVADQRLIVLTALEGLTLLQASEATGLSYGAAKTRLSRARTRLGGILTSEFGAIS